MRRLITFSFIVLSFFGCRSDSPLSSEHSNPSVQETLLSGEIPSPFDGSGTLVGNPETPKFSNIVASICYYQPELCDEAILDYMEDLCLADINADGIVDEGDMSFFTTSNGQRCLQGPACGDMNGDQIVNGSDAVVISSEVQKYSGNTCSQGYFKPECFGDVTHDGVVNRHDIAHISNEKALRPYCSAGADCADLNHDGLVNDQDIQLVRDEVLRYGNLGAGGIHDGRSCNQGYLSISCFADITGNGVVNRFDLSKLRDNMAKETKCESGPWCGDLDQDGEVTRRDEALALDEVLRYGNLGAQGLNDGRSCSQGYQELVCLGDVNGDGVINRMDYSFVRDQMYKSARCQSGNWCGDVNEDGVVTREDLIFVESEARRYGNHSIAIPGGGQPCSAE